MILEEWKGVGSGNVGSTKENTRVPITDDCALAILTQPCHPQAGAKRIYR